MKRLLLIICLAFVGTATTACARQPAPSPSNANSSATANDSHFSRIYADRKCHFRIAEEARQRYDTGRYMFDPTKANPAGWSFGFACHAGISQSDVYDQVGAKPVDGKWIDLDYNEPFQPKQKFKFIEFAGRNWKGIGTTVDQIYFAEANRRSRFFNFCLVENNGPQVLCGRTQIRGVTQPESASKLPEIMAVLKTIEFVDPSAALASPAGAATVH